MKLSYERIYRKTELGVAALKTRTGPLSAQGRTALILINGRESLASLTGKLGADAVALVEMLVALSLVEEVPDAPVPLRPKPPPASEPVPIAAPAPALLARLPSLKREAMIRLAPQFGPDVDVVCRPLLEAATEQAYREALAAIESKLSIYLGRKAAQRMLDGLLP